jgi:hypothetical protein
MFFDPVSRIYSSSVSGYGLESCTSKKLFRNSAFEKTHCISIHMYSHTPTHPHTHTHKLFCKIPQGKRELKCIETN